VTGRLLNPVLLVGGPPRQAPPARGLRCGRRGSGTLTRFRACRSARSQDILADLIAERRTAAELPRSRCGPSCWRGLALAPTCGSPSWPRLPRERPPCPSQREGGVATGRGLAPSLGVLAGDGHAGRCRFGRHLVAGDPFGARSSAALNVRGHHAMRTGLYFLRLPRRSAGLLSRLPLPVLTCRRSSR